MRSIRWLVAILALTSLPVLHAIAQAPPPAPKSGAPAPAPAPGAPGGPAPGAKGAPAPAPGKAVDQSQVQRGKYVATIAGCEDCHTPKRFDPKLGMPVPDDSKAYSGHPKDAPEPEGTVGTHDMALIGPTFTSFKMPFGTVYASNITSDKQTGIGGWTEEQFVKAMRTGRLQHNEPIRPPMPWPNVAAMNDEDIKAVYAFLQSTRPIQNLVKPPNVPREVVSKIGASNDQIASGMEKATTGAPAKGR